MTKINFQHIFNNPDQNYIFLVILTKTIQVCGNTRPLATHDFVSLQTSLFVPTRESKSLTTSSYFTRGPVSHEPLSHRRVTSSTPTHMLAVLVHDSEPPESTLVIFETPDEVGKTDHDGSPLVETDFG